MRYHGKHLVFSTGRSKERKTTSLGVSGGRLKLRSTTDWDNISSDPRSCTAVMLQGNYHTQNCCRSRNISITNPGALLLTHKAMISNSSLHIEDLENGWSPSQQYKRLFNLVIRKQFPFLQEMQFFFSDWAYIFTCSSSGLGTTAHFFFSPLIPLQREEGGEGLKNRCSNRYKTDELPCLLPSVSLGHLNIQHYKNHFFFITQKSH